jgi:hypothetical protein
MKRLSSSKASAGEGVMAAAATAANASIRNAKGSRIGRSRARQSAPFIEIHVHWPTNPVRRPKVRNTIGQGATLASAGCLQTGMTSDGGDIKVAVFDRAPLVGANRGLSAAGSSIGSTRW